LNSCPFNFTDSIFDKETLSKDQTDELPPTPGQNDGDSEDDWLIFQPYFHIVEHIH